jgi:arylsulfatase A
MGLLFFLKKFYRLFIPVIWFAATLSCTKIDNNIKTDNAIQSPISEGHSKPNIVIILEDDIGYEIPKYTGGQSYQTPIMNSLAQAGMQFTHCYASAMCSPSRVMLLTGKYGFRNYHYWGILDTTQKTIANMLHDFGYATCVSGKWQLDGGDASLHKFGFDEYCVFDPFEEPDSADADENRHRYKNPTLFQNGSYLADSVTNGKYSDDIFADFANNFIKKNKRKPFFLYFSFSECHIPFSPPPNNARFATWDPLTDAANKIYFPDMVSYMDSKINTIIKKVAAEGLQDNTYIFIVADNGTEDVITSKYQGRDIQGGKRHTNEFGLHIPLIVIGPSMPAMSINKNIIDFTDFMPTMAKIAGIPERTLQTYGILDGQSFYKQLSNPNISGRAWSYGYYFPYPNVPRDKRVYVQDTIYKLYDVTNANHFFNLQKDSLEQYPIPNDQLTAKEIMIKQNFSNVLASMHN